MKFEGEFMDIVCEMNPEYEKSRDIWEGQKSTVCADLKGDIWNNIEYPSMVWFILYNTIVFGVLINPYEKCIANKVFNEHQFTVGWFVDENKLSNMDYNVYSMIYDKIEDKFGKLSHTTGKNRTFLGMDIELIGKK